jgi:hypothetical protein
MVASSTAHLGPKGRPPLRKCPDDFEVIFVEQGRVGCEAWYRARRETVTRWLEERGKAKLIKARAAYVAHQRANGQWLTRSSCLVEHREIARPLRLQTIRDKRKVSVTLARNAAQHLRIMRNGGYIVSPAPDGDWRVGTRLLSAAQMLDFARLKGFDPDMAALHADDEGEVKS